MNRFWIALGLGLGLAHAAIAGEASTLIEKAEDNTNGRSFQAVLRLKVDNPDYQREMKVRIATKLREKALVKILEPAKDKNSGNLRLKFDLWQFLPNVDRVIKIPTSMMLQNWMGSDFTNDDLVRTSSLSRDYTHKLVAKEKIELAPGETAATAKIECTPKPKAPVVWGKVVVWIRVPDGVMLKQEFYTEKGDLVKVLQGSKVKKHGTHTIPTLVVMRTLKKKSSTSMAYEDVVFDEAISDSVFTQENLRKKAR